MYNNKTSRRIYERAVLQKKTKPFEYSGAPCMIKDRKKFSNIMLTHDMNIREELRTFNPSPANGLQEESTDSEFVKVNVDNTFTESQFMNAVT